jgi:murein DD-endopeptidase MepM/ murein hydrolase activator NlpD
MVYLAQTNMKIALYYPVSPYSLNQGFAQNPAYYARFTDQFGHPEKGHNGNDLAASHGQPIYAPCDGYAQYAEDVHGGEGIYLTTNDLYDYAGGSAQYRIILWHMVGNSDSAYPSPISTDGAKHDVKAGDLIGYADNTGAPFESSGTHLHLGLIPLSASGFAAEPANGFNGCIDPQPFFNGIEAKDAVAHIKELQGEVSTLTGVVSNLEVQVQAQQVIEANLPIVQAAINHISTIPPEHQGQALTLLQEVIQAFENLLKTK